MRAQADLDMREGPKHNIQLGFSSQSLRHMSREVISQSTGRFILRCGDEKEAEEVIDRFNLSEASAAVVRYGLNGPGPAGAPFLAILQADDAKYKQKLVNTLGPIELWALSTTPGDTGLRNRLYEKVGFARRCGGWPRSSRPGRRSRDGAAKGRTSAPRRARGPRTGRGDRRVAGELLDGRGIGLKLRPTKVAARKILWRSAE